MKGEKDYVWEEKFRGRWMPLKGVRITDETAELLNKDTFKNNQRYVPGKFEAVGKPDEPEEKQLSDLSISQLKAYAESKEIDLGKAKKKSDILAILREND